MLIEQIKNLNLVELTRQHALGNSVLIVHISNRSKVDPEIASLGRVLGASTEQLLVENVEMPDFWERIPSIDYAKLTRKVLEWCHD